MNRVEDKFKTLKSHGRKGFIAYICAGDPSLHRTKQLILEFERVGVDVVELGVPFSDPIADGVVNQRAAERALRNHVSLSDIVAVVKDVRKKSQIPIVLFTYVNPVLKYGVVRFCRDLREAGIDGALSLDLPPEEAASYKEEMDAQGLATIGLIAPTTPPDRLKSIIDFSSGFIYYVSRTGVTGMQDRVEKDVSCGVERVKSLTSKPVAVGFGISNPQQAGSVAKMADAVVVGSAIVQTIEKYSSSKTMIPEVGRFVESLVTTVKGVPFEPAQKSRRKSL